MAWSKTSQDLTAVSLSLPHAHAATGRATLSFVTNGHGDSEFEDFIYTSHFFAAAFHVLRAHTLRNCCALVGGYGGEALSLKKVDAGTLCSEVGFETDENEWG